MQLTFSLWKIYMHVFLSLSSEYSRASCRTETHTVFSYSLHSDASAYFFLLLIFTIFLPMAFIISVSTSISGKFASSARKSTLLQSSQQVFRCIARCIIFYFNKNYNLLLWEKLCLSHKKNFYINIYFYTNLKHIYSLSFGIHLKIFYTFAAIIYYNSGKKVMYFWTQEMSYFLIIFLWKQYLSLSQTQTLY